MAACDRGPYSVDCKVLSVLIGVDQLSLFERRAGIYRLDDQRLKFRDIGKYGWPHVVIPAYDYKVEKLAEPFEGIRFSNNNRDVQVVVFRMSLAAMRKHLSSAAKAEVYERYKNASAFQLIERALGLSSGTAQFCAGNPETSVGMFMASSVLPVNGRLTHVYKLSKPEALLLVAAEGHRSMIELIFPGSQDIDSLDYVMVLAPESILIKILGALKEQP